jgi:amino acid transporter
MNLNTFLLIDGIAAVIVSFIVAYSLVMSTQRSFRTRTQKRDDFISITGIALLVYIPVALMLPLIIPGGILRIVKYLKRDKLKADL